MNNKLNHMEQNTPQKNDKNGSHIHVSEKKQDLWQDYLKIQIYKHNLKPEMWQKSQV
jgi:hypothetical protein